MKFQVKTYLFLIIIASYVYAVCEYIPSFSVIDERVTTLYPLVDTTNEFWVRINSTELYVGTMKYYLERGSVYYPLGMEDVYITRGENELHGQFRLDKNLPTGVYMLVIQVGGFEHRIPLTINNSGNEITIESYESEGNLYLEIGNIDESVEVMRKIIYYNGKSDTVYYKVAPTNKTAIIKEILCKDCKIEVYAQYKGLNAKAEVTNGIYSEPALKVLEFNKKRIVFESCATGNYNVLVNGKNVGDFQGIGRIELPLTTGYEEVDIKFVSGGVLLNKELQLVMFKGNEIKENIDVIDTQPLTVQLSASDEYERDVLSKGMVEIKREGVVVYRELVEFTGKKRITVNLPDGKYTIEYNGKTIDANAKLLPKEEIKIPEQVPTPVMRDFVPILIIVLIVALVILVIIWLRKWGRY